MKDHADDSPAKQFPNAEAIRALYKSEGALEFFKEKGSLGGKKGGAAGGKRAAERMTPAERSARAKKASLAAAAAMTPEQRSERARKASLKAQENRAAVE